MTGYTIKHGQFKGTRLEIGRVPRHLIDRFIGDNPEPEPPMVKASELGVEVWGDDDEELPNHDDATYLAALIAWRVDMAHTQIDLIAPAVSVPENTEAAALAELEEMRAAHLVEGNGKSALLQSVIVPADADLNAVVELVMYNSTVTLRGIDEAARRFGVKKNGHYVTVFGKGKGNTRANSEFNDRAAAQWAGYRWVGFCELPGPEQSAIVTHYRLNGRLEEMAARGVK